MWSGATWAIAIALPPSFRATTVNRIGRRTGARKDFARRQFFNPLPRWLSPTVACQWIGFRLARSLAGGSHAASTGGTMRPLFSFGRESFRDHATDSNPREA